MASYSVGSGTSWQRLGKNGDLPDEESSGSWIGLGIRFPGFPETIDVLGGAFENAVYHVKLQPVPTNVQSVNIKWSLRPQEGLGYSGPIENFQRDGIFRLGNDHIEFVNGAMCVCDHPWLEEQRTTSSWTK